MGFEWDQSKAEANIRKHRVDFADAVTALDDPCALTVGEEMSGNEERCVTVGLDATGSLLVVVWTLRGETLRLISARPATRAERRQYEEAR